MGRTQVGMRATVTQALRLGQYFFCIIIEIGHKNLDFCIFTAIYSAKAMPTPQKRQKQQKRPKKQKNVAFYRSILSKKDTPLFIKATPLQHPPISPKTFFFKKNAFFP